MKKITSLLVIMLFAALLPNQLHAQEKKVLYLNSANAKVEDGTSIPGLDPITRMLNADPNFSVTAGTIDGSGLTADNPTTPGPVTDYDLIIVQESNASGNTVWFNGYNGDGSVADSPYDAGGPLSLKNISVPVIYCKTEAFRNGKAVSSAAAGIAKNKSSLSVTVPADNQSHELFSGIDFSAGNDVTLFYETKEDNGKDGGSTALKVLNDLEISDPAAGTLATTPEVTDASKAMVINYIPAGTQLGTQETDKAAVDIVALAFGYGAQVGGNGDNITPEALTIWRNAAYKLTGLTPPTELYEVTPVKLLYVNQVGVGSADGASAPGFDPVIRMLKSDSNFDVTYVETPQDGSGIPDLAGFDVVIAQETISSGAPLWASDGGVLGIKNVNIPIIYNKSYAFQGGKPTLTDPDASVTRTANLAITVSEVEHPLFRGISFESGLDIPMFNAPATGDDGSLDGDPSDNRSIDVVNDLDISDANTLLATVPEVEANPEQALVINYLPAGTALGTAETDGELTDRLKVDAVTFTFSYGAMIAGNGTNITNDNLTLWRNAAYQLAGLTSPETVYEPAPMRIAYVQKADFMYDAEASTSTNDPIIQMYEADPNFMIDIIETDSEGTGLDLSGYDLVVAQETFGSGDGIWSNAFGVQTNTTPIIFNKSWAWQNNKGHITSDASAVTNSGATSVSIDASNQGNALFSGIDFDGGNEILLYAETADNSGAEGDNSIDVLNDIEIGVTGTNLATVADVTTTPDTSIIINDIPMGTQIGTNEADVLKARMVAFAFNYGAIIRGNGANISPEALTIWRNAAYTLTGLTVPTTLVENPEFVLSIDKVGEVSNVSSNVKAIGNRILVSEVKSTTEVKIYSITGALVKSFKTNTDVDFEFRSGIYIATLKTFEGTKAAKLLVK